MPDYFPTVAPPTGLAEEMIRQMERKGEAWQNAIQSLGQNIGQNVQRYEEKKRNQITPEQIQGLNQAVNVPANLPGQTTAPTFAGGIGGNKPLNIAQSTYLQQIMQQKSQEERILALQGLKGRQSEEAITSKATQAQSLEDLKAKHKAELEEYKTAHPKTAQKGTTKEEDAANRKIVSDYAASHGISLDALRPGGMGGWSSPNLAMAAQVIKDHPEYDTQKMKLQFTQSQAAAQSAGRAPNSPQMFKIRALANSLVPQLDLLGKASDAVERGDVKSINSLKGKMGIEFSNKDWSNLKKRAMITADEFQAQIGAGSDAKLDLAKQLIDTSDSPDVLKNAIGVMRSAVKARAIASTGAEPTEEQISGQSQTTGMALPSNDDIQAELKRRGVQ